MANSLKQLIDDRRQMLDVLQRNGSAAGIQRLLTDLYPDSAHFVYELLQNAEDAGATKVEFILNGKGVYFAHNGAREFTLDDVDAITAIGGNLGKREDSTSIGEFGVGFKAVFSYTLTPEIHSGKFHFRIRDHFLVETDGVTQNFLRHGPSERWTEFDLPFNNPEKPLKRAYEETLSGLRKLDETSLLFLRNIESIEWSVEGNDSLSGYAKRIEGADNRVEIACKTPGDREKTASFLRFSRDETIVSERGKRKTLPIAVAYALEEADGKTAAIAPIDGKTFVYFPAEKEYSKLRFHINAPFSATVARDSIRDCDDNDALIGSVASLVAESLASICEWGLLTTSFYAVMPNEQDGLSRTYLPIQECVTRAFAENDYLVAKFDGRVRSVDALRGAREYSDLLGTSLLETFAGVRGRWISTQPRNISRRENDFLDTLEITEFDAHSFAVAFNEDDRRSVLMEEALRRGSAWLKLLYTAYHAVYTQWRTAERGDAGSTEEKRYRAYDRFMRTLRETPFVKCLDGRLHKPSESFFIPEGFSADTINDPIVDPKLVGDSEKGRYYDPSGIRDMLRASGVEVYSLEVELKRLVAQYASISDDQAHDVATSDGYYNDILNLARAHNRGIDVPVAGIRMFIGKTVDGKTRFKAPEELALGDDYGIELGDELARFQHLPTVHPVYARKFKGEDLGVFAKFMRHAGAWTGLRIVECRVQDNPAYLKMSSRGGKPTSKGAQFDYTIRGLPESLDVVSPGVSFAIWKLLCECGSTSKFAEAYYRSNARSEAQTADSQLVYHLKNHAWLPDLLGGFHKPGEIKFHDLEPAYREIGDGKLIAALDLGSEISAQKIAENKLKSDAERLGQHVISDEDYQLLQKFKEQERKAAEKLAAKEAQKLNAQEYLDKQSREQRPNKLDGTREDSGAVRNPERRARKIDETIKDLEELPVKKRERFSLVADSSVQERETLREWYRGRCQICDTVILRHDGEPLFEAINIISSSDLPERHRNSVELGWNSLCLCPNCAAKYKYSGKKLSGFMEQVHSAEVFPGDEGRIPIRIELAGRTTEIKFTPKHFIALKQGMRRLDESAQ
ncbi:MAG: hypothetical protein IJH04_07005 [Eggerthellaceae bacterium]|nr:hypothetical protein [Eggerthellaceae bacterium]